MRVTTIGDLLLDVIVRLEGPLAPGDDRMAETSTGPGGQAANVAAWAAALGAAGALATVRHSSRRLSRRPRNTPAGLAAFEDAPCFLEHVGEEAQRYREGGETSAGTSNPT
jgi:hypothetical protein